MRVKVDEDLPRAALTIVVNYGHDAVRVRKRISSRTGHSREGGNLESGRCRRSRLRGNDVSGKLCS